MPRLENITISRMVMLALALFCQAPAAFPQHQAGIRLPGQVESRIRELMDEGDIPGLSLVLIKGDRQLVRHYGYADLEDKKPVTSRTLFELGSCSKAFTALAVQQLVAARAIRPDGYVTEYIPWFRATHKGRPAPITVRQLLHHTSGIPWNTIARIPATQAEDALERTVKAIDGVALHQQPGKQYEYATVNYDVLALIVEQVTGQPFEQYLQRNVLAPLQLTHTSIGEPADAGLKATGYKTSFFEPRKYQAPVYRGNNAAGYVTSDAGDVARWLRFQMGLLPSDLYGLAAATQQRDAKVPLHNMAAYAAGWEVALDGTGEIYHAGLNPNYTAFIAFRPEERIGVAVLANSNSSLTEEAGRTALRWLAGEELSSLPRADDRNDKTYSLLSFALAAYLLVVSAFAAWVVYGAARRKRPFAGLTLRKAARLAGAVLVTLPFLYALYVLPRAMGGFTWEAAFVWTPVSFRVLAALVPLAVGATLAAYLLSVCFPEKDRFRQKAPSILLVSVLSGLSNMLLIILVTTALEGSVELKFLVFYYALTILLYLAGRKYVQTQLIMFTRDLIYDLRIKLLDKIFSTSYQKFEKMDRGRIYTALNDDVGTIGESANMFVMLTTNLFTAAGAFVYLASMAFWATVLTLLLVGAIATLYFVVSRSTNAYFEQARDTRDVFMRLLNGMIDGFKELSLHRNKKLAYKADVAHAANEYRVKISTASIRFVNAFLVGESMLLVLLGAVVFAIPVLFPGIRFQTVMGFVIVLLYLIGPINGILSSVPAVMRIRIAWNRIQGFLREIPATLDLNEAPRPVAASVESIRATGVRYQYKHKQEQDAFTVGPIDLEVRAGEILFLVGGNGSGKTTLAKLLMGLYEPDAGAILINDKAVGPAQLSEHFSAVFSPAHLFEKLYNVDAAAKAEAIEKYLGVLDLEEKVQITGNRYNTIQLSGGQVKRLALLQCYLEDSPVYLFDEWAADQDPAYRHFFYRTLLPEMKKAGKIVIAITHDDHYFDVADKLLNMKHGKLEAYTNTFSLTGMAAG